MAPDSDEAGEEASAFHRRRYPPTKATRSSSGSSSSSPTVQTANSTLPVRAIEQIRRQYFQDEKFIIFTQYLETLKFYAVQSWGRSTGRRTSPPQKGRPAEDKTLLSRWKPSGSPTARSYSSVHRLVAFSAAPAL